jgi:hypothetical protein
MVYSRGGAARISGDAAVRWTSAGDTLFACALERPPERASGEGSIPFRLSPEIPILRVSWLGPTEAVIDLGKGLEAGQKYMLIGEGGPFAGAKARFFTQPLAIVQAEGGYLWEEKPDAYHHAIYLRANAELSERDFKGQWGQRT